MASSKVMASLSSRSSDLSRKSSSGSSRPKPQPTPLNSAADRPITVEEFLRRSSSSAAGESTVIDTPIMLLDGVRSSSTNSSKTVDEVWREIVSGESQNRRKQCKEEPLDGVMTLEDFLLAKTGAGAEDDEEEDEVDVKNFALATSLSERLSGRIFGFDPASPSSFGFDAASPSSFGFDSVESSVVRKRGRGVLEPLDKAAQQRQRRMIKNRESAARSRERKQAYQVELESLAVRLEEEHEQLLKEKAERTKERFKQLMEKIIPIEEKRRPPRVLRRVRSIEW